MKRTTTIVLFASIFAVAVGTLGLSGNSAALVTAASQSPEPVGMLGHQLISKPYNTSKMMQH